MLLLEESQNDIFIAYYKSSNILMSKYIYSEQKLLVIFNKGHQYIYEKVIPYHYQRFKVAKSQGEGLKTHIIKNYTAIKTDLKLNEEQLQTINDQITQLSKQTTL